MAFAPCKSNSSFHVRSVSLPTKTHPLSTEIEERLKKLDSCETSTSPLSSFGSKVSSLEDVYECLDDLVQLPNTKQEYANNEELVGVMLDSHLMLLDLCSFSREILSQAKEDVQGLVSKLHRKNDSKELARYLTSRKKQNKVIIKSIKGLKSLSTTAGKDNETMHHHASFKMLEATTFMVLQSLLSYILRARSQFKIKALVTKLVSGKKIVDLKNGEKNVNDLQKIDEDINFLLNEKACEDEKALRIENLKINLMKMESNIQDVEEGLESLFRRLIRTRVSLLNILN